MRLTSRRPPSSKTLARFCTQVVMSLSAGPPLVGLYLKPPLSGGLCEGVMTMPSASPALRPWLCTRMAWLTAGVGVNSPPAEIMVCTPLAASTSIALSSAGCDSAWVSAPINSGPLMPWLLR